MAARLNRRHQDAVREKIRASQLINRLEDHALDGAELSATQIKAIEILLKKAIPDLSAVQAEISGDINFRQMTDDELDRAIADAAREAGVAAVVAGAGAAEQDPEAV